MLSNLPVRLFQTNNKVYRLEDKNCFRNIGQLTTTMKPRAQAIEPYAIF
jgi:hypothetical protein